MTESPVGAKDNPENLTPLRGWSSGADLNHGLAAVATVLRPYGPGSAAQQQFLRQRQLLATGAISLLLLLLLTACDDIHPISHSGAGAYEASMATLPDGFAVAWYDDRDGNPEIYFRLLDARGRPKSREFRATNDPELSYEADIAAAGDNLAIAWYERFPNGNLRARLGMWSQSGEPLWTKTVSTTSRSTRNILVRAHGNELFAAWVEDLEGEAAEIWAGWWDMQGQTITAPRRLAPASRTTWNLNALVDGSNRAWIVFDAKAGTRNNELFLLRTEKTNSEIAQLTADDGSASKYPDLAFTPGSGRAALTWFDERDGNQEVYLFVAATTDFHQGLESRARRVTETRGESIGAYVSWNTHRFGLSWCDNTAGQHEVYFQPFDSSGMPLGTAQRLTNTRTDSLIPTIKPSADGFALIWNEYASKGPGHSGGRSEIVFSFAR
jgi:hypothetical protein